MWVQSCPHRGILAIFISGDLPELFHFASCPAYLACINPSPYCLQFDFSNTRSAFLAVLHAGCSPHVAVTWCCLPWAACSHPPASVPTKASPAPLLASNCFLSLLFLLFTAFSGPSPVLPPLTSAPRSAIQSPVSECWSQCHPPLAGPGPAAHSLLAFVACRQ